MAAERFKLSLGGSLVVILDFAPGHAIEEAKKRLQDAGASVISPRSLALKLEDHEIPVHVIELLEDLLQPGDHALILHQAARGMQGTIILRRDEGDPECCRIRVEED